MLNNTLAFILFNTNYKILEAILIPSNVLVPLPSSSNRQRLFLDAFSIIDYVSSNSI